jgi:hypothetical protein
VRASELRFEKGRYARTGGWIMGFRDCNMSLKPNHATDLRVSLGRRKRRPSKCATVGAVYVPPPVRGTKGYESERAARPSPSRGSTAAGRVSA